MPLSLPKLDDRTFSDLSAELRGLIPQYSKSWTDHNPSDPGIILLELLAWHAEMVLYRVNQINDRSYMNFVEMIGVEPSGPQAEITFEIDVATKDELPENFIMHTGTRVTAIDELSGQETVFETVASITKEDGWWDTTGNCWVFKALAVNTIEIKDEVLGESNGLANQEFAFSHKPIFLNKNNEEYSGNPKITIAGEQWDNKNDLLESQNTDNHFTVEQIAGLIRFGGGEDAVSPSMKQGRIPPQGEEIICSYQTLGGVQGNVAAGAINVLKETDNDYTQEDHIVGIDPSLNTIKVINEYAATGGVELENLEDLLKKGLERIQERYRAVSEVDFECLAKQAVPGKVARVKVIFNQNLEMSTPKKDGHVSLIILPKAEALDLSAEPTDVDTITKNLTLTHTCTDITAAFTSYHAEKIIQSILWFLDNRRLITTVIHVVIPTFTSINLDITISPKSGINTISLKDKILENIASFLDPYKGWEDGKGWPFGRDVYRSELYQQLEGIAGVDHVVSMSINGVPDKIYEPVGQNDLVCVNIFNVTIASS